MKIKKTFALISILLSPVSFAGDWVDNWFDNAVYDKPSSYQGQQRGFYSAGGFSARLQSKTDYPITASAPKLKVGCGGIDAFMGGVSFLDADYLVEKAQGVMQATPYVALDMGMKVMCKECSDTLNKVEQISNFLNQIQLNECALAKPIATAMVETNPEALQGLWTEVTGTKNLDEATTRMWGETTDKVKDNDGSPTTSLKDQVIGCSREFRDITKNGSVIQNITSKIGIPEHAQTIRGFVGDVVINTPSDVPIGRKLAKCSENSNFNIDNLLYGQTYTMDLNGICTKSNGRGSVRDTVKTRLQSIADKIKNKGTLTVAETSFINASPNIAIYPILLRAIQDKTVPETVDFMTDLVAVYYTYTIFNDLYRNAESALIKSKEAAQSPTASSGDACRPDLYAPVFDKFGDIIKQSRTNQVALAKAYQIKVNQLNNSLQFNNFMQKKDVELKKRSVTSGIQ